MAAFSPHHDLAFRIEGGRFLEKLQSSFSILSLLVFQAELDEDLWILRFLEALLGQSLECVCPFEDIEDFFMQFVRRRRIAGDPVEFDAVSVQE